MRFVDANPKDGSVHVCLVCLLCATSTALVRDLGPQITTSSAFLSVWIRVPLDCDVLLIPTCLSCTIGPPDLLMVLRADSQRRGFPLAQNNPSVGIMLARLAPDCRPLQGPLATGVRLQDCIRLSGPGGAPVELDMALGKVSGFCWVC